MDITEQLKQHKHIIFAYDHYNTLGVLRSLGEVGIKAIVILHGDKSYLVKHSSFLNTFHRVKTVEDGYKLMIENYGNEKLKPFVYSCDDFVESYLDMHYEELIDKFFFFDGGQNGIVSKYMDKEEISKLALECGAKVPKTEKLKRGELPSTLRYPVITKSLMSIKGGWKDDVFICQNEEELKMAYTKIKSEDLLVEEFIDKKNELCLDGFCVNHGKDVCIPYQSTYIRVAPGKYGNYMTLEPFKNETVLRQVEAILEKSGFNGIFSVEYLIDKNDDLWFLEVNYRNSTWSYAFTVGGVNMPLQWAKGMLMSEIDRKSFEARKKPFTAMVEPIDFGFVVKRKISFSKWYKDMKACDCLFFYHKNDIKPAISGWAYVLSLNIKKLFKR